MKKFIIALIPFVLIACSTTKGDVAGAGKTASNPAMNSSMSSSTSSNSNATTGSAATNAETQARQLAAAKMAADKLNASVQSLQKQSIYFDFDKSEIKPEYRDVLQQQAEFVMAHKNDIVTVQGNCDERGSDEYNLALGNRRADAAQKNLELLGVSSSQIKTVSFGEEKPRLTCHEEKCWKENRRDDFIHQLN